MSPKTNESLDSLTDLNATSIEFQMVNEFVEEFRNILRPDLYGVTNDFRVG